MSVLRPPGVLDFEGRGPSDSSRRLGDSVGKRSGGHDEPQAHHTLLGTIDQVSLVGDKGEAQAAAADIFDTVQFGDEDVGDCQRLHYRPRVVWHNSDHCLSSPVVPKTLSHDASPRTEQLPREGLNYHEHEAANHASVKKLTSDDMMTEAFTGQSRPLGYSPWGNLPLEARG